MIPQILTAKAATAAAAAVLFAGTGAAAATGSLPAPVQRAASDALEHVSISVPTPNEHANVHATQHTPDHTDGRSSGATGPDANGPAKQGLCIAWSARSNASVNDGNSSRSVAFTNLRNAANLKSPTIAEFCHDVITAHDDHTSGSSNQPDHAAPATNAGPGQADRHRPTRPIANDQPGRP